MGCRAKPVRPTKGLPAGPVVLLCTLLVLFFLPAWAVADTLQLKDGTTYEGQIVEQTSDYVVFKVNSGGISGDFRFETKDITSLKEGPLESAQSAGQFETRWAAALEAGTGRSFADLGQWAQDNRLYPEAAKAFEKARQLAPEQDPAYGLAAAQNWRWPGISRPPTRC